MQTHCFAAFNLGDARARYGSLYPPLGLLYVVAAIRQAFPTLEIRVFSQPHLDEADAQVMVGKAIEEMGLLSGALIAVPTEIDYARAIKLIEALRSNSINNIILGGFPFSIGQYNKAYLTATRHRVFVCDSTGEEAGIGFVRYCLGEVRADAIPNTFLPNGKYTTVVPPTLISRTKPPLLPLEVWDPRETWHHGMKNTAELLAAEKLGFKIGAWQSLYTGNLCSYAVRNGIDPESGIHRNRCSYCSSGSRTGILNGTGFWKNVAAVVDHTNSNLGVQGAIKFRTTADDYGNLRPILRKIGAMKPEWAQGTMCLEVYLRCVDGASHAEELRNALVVQSFIGADGKGYQPDFDGPLAISLGHLASKGILANITYVIGKYAESWDSLDAWYKQACHFSDQFSGTISFIGGYLNWVLPGSWDFHHVVSRYPELVRSDSYDLAAIRRVFWQEFTDLGKATGPGSDQIEGKLRDYADRFNSLPPMPGDWSFGRLP